MPFLYAGISELLPTSLIAGEVDNLADFFLFHQKDVAKCKMLKPSLLCLLVLAASEVTVFNTKV